jgi:hypothetical protein
MMNLYYLCLLLLLGLSVFPEGPQHAKPPNVSVSAVVSPVDSSSALLGILALGLPQNEVFEIILAHNGYNMTVLPYFGYYKSVNLPEWVFISYLNQKIRNLTSHLIYGGNQLAWAIRIALECLQHVLKLYTWLLSENQMSINFRCRLAGLFLKQCLFRKHDFAALVYKLYRSDHNLHCQHLELFPTYEKHFYCRNPERPSDSLNHFECYGGGKALIFSSDELLPYASANLNEKQYQFL